MKIHSALFLVLLLLAFHTDTRFLVVAVDESLQAPSPPIVSELRKWVRSKVGYSERTGGQENPSNTCDSSPPAPSTASFPNTELCNDCLGDLKSLLIEINNKLETIERITAQHLPYLPSCSPPPPPPSPPTPRPPPPSPP
eukprot:CAMPEP_0114272906 /NCGR_PEP_ID=MMETSP0058-20121206/28771_1 /TAXON_ID=36894 /ORGANISM="Pyramimonas parkeae, CCMP726" /LENGTH=139 /DNA_ID=CAMNT_0001392241 /DNA_START=99 /DNA_END=514 /DNA_ORIENTATION=-